MVREADGMSAREVVTRSAYFMISIYAFVFLRKILREDGGFSFFRVMVLRGEIIMNTLRSVYKELHADHETGAADNK